MWLRKPWAASGAFQETGLEPPALPSLYSRPVRKSEFARAIADEFGEVYGRALTRDLVLPALGNVTADDAIGRGDEPRDVWLALCEAEDVPPARRHGAGLPKPRR
ncbi:MAG: signal transduction histidine kinase [Frondihabitans sp.]|nr:signal transduction histidine kinase [Frondihabitans sp.]